MSTVLLILILLAVIYYGQKATRIMADLNQAIADLNDATNSIADRVTALSAQLAGNMTPAQVADAQTQLEAIATRLKGLAADPANPVPAPVATSPTDTTSAP